MEDAEKEEKKPSTIAQARQNVQKRMVAAIAAGLAVVIGFAWNDAIKSAIELIIPGDAASVLAKFVYAVLITVIVGLALFFIERAMADKERKS
jgi:formate/nitrite transporter FocA (FNT family)